VFIVERAAGPFPAFRFRRKPSAGGHTAEELKYIIRSSQLEQFENTAIGRLLDLDQYVAREIMVPRIYIVSLPVDADLDRVLRSVNEQQYRASRYTKAIRNISSASCTLGSAGRDQLSIALPAPLVAEPKAPRVDRRVPDIVQSYGAGGTTRQHRRLTFRDVS
jgi:hypothetical protein